MQFIPYEAYQYFQHTTGMTSDQLSDIWGTTISGNDVYTEWVEKMHYHSESTGAKGMPSTYFWLAVRLPKDNYAEKIDFHPNLPMLVPISGTQTKILGIYGNKRDVDKAMEEDVDHVHLLYKMKLQGSLALYKFLEHMAENNMIEKVE